MTSQTVNFHITPISSNSKTGPIPVTTSGKQTCPDSCPLKDNGCYAVGPLAIHWKAVTEGKRGDNINQFCASIKKLPVGQLWRHNQAGDLPGIGEAIDSEQLDKIVRANKRKKGFTYTHKPLTKHNLAAIASANKQGFVINLSSNNVAQADEYIKHGLPVVTLLPGDTTSKVNHTPAGHKVVTCPAAIRDTNCARCGLCARGDRDYIIGFPVHGTSHKKATIACNIS
jgi:hypothetical protein